MRDRWAQPKKMKIGKSKNSKWGNFTLIPKEGWKISQEFIDFESQLLWVSESPIDTSNIEPNEYGTRFIPTNSYVIDQNEGRILPPEEWRKKFDYSIKELLIEGTDFKLIEERKPMPKGNQDSIEEKLINLKDGRIYSQGSGIAFREKKRQNAYERYLENKENQKRRLDKSKSQLSLEHFYHDCFLKLNFEDIILMYSHDNFPYIVKVSNQNKVYIQKGTEIPKDYQERVRINYQHFANFSSINEFWKYFASNENWFELYSPYSDARNRKINNSILAYYIIHEANSIRNTLSIDWRKYKEINKWGGLFDLKNLNTSEIIQVCSNCLAKVRYNPRYPRYICGNCVSQLSDESGRLVSYYNTSMGGGCEGKYVNSDEKYENSICYIGDKEFYAMEARFGGIVIQLKSAIEYMI